MTDSYGREINYLRLSVTERCNLRCRYCMPEEGICKKPHEDMLTEEEMVAAVRAAAELGITKLRLTGGEPLVKKNILSLCRQVSAVPGIREVAMTTNGILLPGLAKDLRQCGVRRLNISLDTLQPERYASITRRGELGQALQGIRAALDADFEKIKLNAVLIGGFNDDEIRPLAELTLKLPVDMRFIELMPMCQDSPFGSEAFLPGTEVLRQLPELEPVPGDSGVAQLYRLPGARGNVGLIHPVSSHFCACCNRIRLTADGYVKPCLHSPEEFCLKGLQQEEMKEVLRQAIANKPVQHGDLTGANRSRAGRSMNRIGG